MAVRVDDAGHDVLAGGLDHADAGRRAQPLPALSDLCDFAVFHEHVGVLQRPRADGEHGGAADQQVAARLSGREAVGGGGLRARGGREEAEREREGREKADHRASGCLVARRGTAPMPGTSAEAL